MGLQNATIMLKVKPNIDEVKSTIENIVIPDKFDTFRITTKRQNKKFEHTSPEVNIIIGDFIREKFNKSNNESYRKKTNLDYIRSQLNWIIIITFYIALFNLTPYLWTGNLSDFIYGIKLNSIDYVNHNIFERQYVNIGRNPILYPILLAMAILPLTRIWFRKIT